MKRGSSNVPKSKLDQIKSGAVTKKQVGNVNENKTVIHGKGGKFAITETEKKFEESGVTRKKRNYVMYQSKLGTEKEQDLKKIQAAPKPRREEQIVQTRKKVEYLDNYQYHETKDIKDKDPNKVSVVTHRRLGDIMGGSYEVSTFQRNTFTDSGKGAKLYSSQTTKTTTTRKNAPQPSQPAKTVKKTETTTKTSRTLPAQSRDYRKEVKKTTTNTTNLKTVPRKPAAAPPAQAPSRRGKPSANPAKPTTTTTKTTKTTTTKTTTTRTRTQSAGTGRRH
jgi:hypothetical protein